MQQDRHTTRRSSAGTFLVASTALSSVSVLALAAVLLMASPHQAQAASECGADGAGASVVSCAAGTYADGITYNPSDGLTLNLNDPGMVVQKTGGGTVPAISLSGSTSNALVVNATNFGSITSTSGNVNGINVSQGGTGLSAITMNAGSISAYGGGGGLNVNASGGGNAEVTLNGGQIVNTYSGAPGGYGVNAQVSGGNGSATAVMTGGSILVNNTSGAVGLRAAVDIGASTASASATLSGGSITTVAGVGVLAQTRNGNATVTMTDGSVLTQGGTNAYGLSAGSNLFFSLANPLVVMSGGSVTTHGVSSDGINSRAQGARPARIQMSGGTVSASGALADGLFAGGGGGGTYDVAVTGGTITAGSSFAAGIHTAAAGGGTVNIGTGAFVNGGASGVAIRDGDLNRDGTDETGGAATITTAGTLNGAVVLGTGNDVVNVTGGAINGNITGGGSASLNFALGSGSFTYGSAYTISGMNAVTMTSGTAQIDGVLNTNTLTLNGGTLIVNGTVTPVGAVTIAGGILQLGANSASGSIAGNIVNNGVFVFNRSDSAAFGNVISGTGSVMQNGSGTTILTSDNTYTGGTTISAGTLQVGNGGTTGAILGDVVANGTLAFNRSDTYTFGGTISGTGSVSQAGTGTTILSGANSYTGGTTISGGTLQLGSGGTAGGIVGNVTNNGALAFNRSDAVVFGGAISGSGSVSQLGSGTTTLSGVNTYAGGTTIAAGTLSGSGASFGSGAILNNAALVIDQPAEVTFANAINGTGSFTKQGAGRLNYTGTGTLSGATTVAAGLLSVNGALANSAVTVLSGASLGGTGTVGATSVQSGGTVAPGNSIGTLQINGPYTQAAGSVYQVEVDPNSSASDRIAVTGTATLQSGAGLNVVKNPPGDYRPGTIYTVLTASGGLSGTYALTGETSGVSAFLGLRDSYDANNAYLTVVQTRDPVDAAQTPNQQAVAENLPGPVTPPVLNLPSDEAARGAFDQLSAQALASAKGALVSNGLYVRDATLDRLRDVRCRTDENQTARRAACESEQPSLWAQGFGGWGGVSGNANASGLHRSAAGMLAGFDLPIMDWRAGIFAGFSNSDFHLTGGPASGESTDYHLGAYGGTSWDQISLSLGASYSWNAIRTDRSVAFGNFTDRLQGTYNAGVTQIFAEVGYGMEMMGITLEPFANLAYLNLRTDGFTEVGSAAALTSQADTTENVISTFGVRPSTTLDLGSFPVTLRGMAGWRHTFGTVTPTSTVAFAGGNNFTVSGAPIARDAMALEAGVDFAVADNISAGLTYGGQISSRTTDQTARGTIRVAF